MFIVKFIKDYWFLILPSVEIFCTVLILLIRKKPVKVVDTLKEVIVRVLPALINQAENINLIDDKGNVIKSKGFEKKSACLSSLISTLEDLGYDKDLIGQYLSFADEQIELILSTPQKKGIKL